ncbi:hypothetical protein ACWC24_11760 [Streptomyces sp. NPDC001443]
MPVPSDAEPGHAGLPLIDLAAARELFRTAEVTGLGTPGSDEIFDRWLGEFRDIAFYRNADRPLQARPVGVSDGVPEWLDNTRVGRARLEAVCFNPSRPAPEEGPAVVSTEDEEWTDEDDEEWTDETDEDDEEALVCSGTPLCWHCEPDRKRYAKVDNGRHRQDDGDEGDDEDGEDQEGDGGDGRLVLELVKAYRMMFEDPSFDLSGELPPDFRAYSLRTLTLLTEAARRKLDAERWDTVGPWHLVWSSCETDVTNPAWEGEDFNPSGDDPDEESDAIHCHASITNDDDAPVLQIVGTRWGEQHIMHYAPVYRPGDEFPDVDTLDGLRDVLTRATERLGEAGYEMSDEWSVDWSRCHIQLDDN